MHPIRFHRLGVLLVAFLLGIGVCSPAALAALDVGLAPPVAVDDAVTVRTGSPVTFDVLGNDTDADGDELGLTSPPDGVPTDTPHGTVECASFGDCTYTSDTGYLGPDSFDYTVSDGNAGTDVGHVSITVVVNRPPTADDDVLELRMNTTKTVFVLGNDFDPDGDDLTVTTPTPSAAHGSVTCDEFGECLYAPTAGYVGPDGFDYSISDGSGGTDSAHVSITVSANIPPTANADAYARADLVVMDVLDNDADDDGDDIEIVSVTQGSFGSVAINPDQTLSYSQTSNFAATDSFTYTISDGLATATATVTLDPCPAVASALDHGGLVVSERWLMCSSILANGTVGPTTTVLPPFGGTSALFTSGDRTLAPGPNDSSGAGENNHTTGRGSFDPSILRLGLNVPAGANCLSFDLAFQSEEYPEFVNQAFNDGFLAELDASTWSITGSDISAPANFAFDSAGGIVSVNGSFFEPDRVVVATGSQYDGSTPLLSVRTPITPGAHVLYLSIFDAGDPVLDSAAFVDHLQAGTAGPGGCSAGANEPPNAVDDSLTTGEDTQAFLNVLGNDSDPDNHPITVTTLSPTAQHGSASCTAGGVCTYTPLANYFGPDSFTYTISDGHGGTDSATVSITVTPVQDDPEAVADVINTTEGSPGSANVLANDFDVDGDTPLTITSFTQGLHGSVTCAGTNCTYTPAPGYSGPDSFTYTISDGHGGTDVGTVAVTVASGNDPPVADDDALTTAEDTAGQVNVLDGDTDPDGDTLTVTTLAPTAAHGTVSCTAAGVCTYTPAANYNGPDSFSYTVSDGHGGTDTATVNVTVTPANDAPDAVNDALTTAEDTTSAPLNVLANDTDVDGDSLIVTTLTPAAAHGTVSCTAAGLCTYTPAANYNGPDSFTYSISDGHGGTDSATVNVTVTSVNDAPDAVNDSLTTPEDTQGSLNVVANDTDVDGDTRTVTTLTPTAAHGTVSCTAAGVCTYTPAANYNGPDSFTYSISDGHGGTDSATVSITVTPVNDAPDAVNDSLTTAENVAGQVNVLANDTDLDGDALTVTTLTPTAGHGTVSCTAAGLCTYTPAADYDGPDSFSYSISDGHGGTDTATVNVTVTPVTPTNTPPVADDDTMTTPEDVFDSVNVLVGDSDADGDTLTVTTLAPTAAHGTVACLSTGTCEYTPAANYNGPDGFDYTVSDGHGGFDVGHVSITVTPVNDPPVADDELLSVNEDASGNVSVLVGDTDVDGDSLSVTTLSPTAAHGTVACTAAGVCTYTPAANYFGSDGFDYTVSDGNGGTDTGHVSITVNAVNDPPVADDETMTTNEDTPENVNVLEGDTDIDGGTLVVTTLAPAAAHGTVSCTAAGVCTYTPAANYNGPDGFDYTVSDGAGGTDVGHVSITVNAVPDAPDARDDALTTPADTAGNVNVLANDTDGDGDALTVTTLTPTATNGTVACLATGMCTYTPNPGFAGSDSFQYSISDGNGGADTATVLVTVSADTNTPPSCANVKPSKTKLWPPRHKFILITLAGATDADGDPLTFQITAVTQDEKVKGAISKNDKGPDAQRVAGKPNQIKLRAERIGSGNGRVYRVFFTVSDGQGGTCTGRVKVGVPRNKNGNAIDNVSRSYNSFG